MASSVVGEVVMDARIRAHESQPTGTVHQPSLNQEKIEYIS